MLRWPYKQPHAPLRLRRKSGQRFVVTFGAEETNTLAGLQLVIDRPATTCEDT